MANLEQTCIITNGEPSKETLDGYAERGYIHLSTLNAAKFHPYAMATDMISFFAKPINKETYDAHMQQWNEENAVYTAGGAH